MTIFGWRLVRAREADWCIKLLNESKLDAVSDGRKYNFDGYVRVHHNVVQRTIDVLCGKP